jgi:hypothetical protein
MGRVACATRPAKRHDRRKASLIQRLRLTRAALLILSVNALALRGIPPARGIRLRTQTPAPTPRCPLHASDRWTGRLVSIGGPS